MKLVESFPVPADHLGRMRDDEVVVYIRGEHAGRLKRHGHSFHGGAAGWSCDADLAARIPWPPRSRSTWVSVPAAIRTIRRRFQAVAEAERSRAAMDRYRASPEGQAYLRRLREERQAAREPTEDT